MSFVNRRTELKTLEAWWEKPYPRPALIWGRRRVGKTSLVQEFAKGRRAIFHLGLGRTESGELAQLSLKVAAAQFGGARNLTSRPYSSWEETLDHLASLAREEPLLLVLDEFPEMVTKSPELPGILRAFLDLSREKTQLRILLCGSAVRTMQAIQEYRAPLYGRFDLNIHLHPFRPHEAAQMLPDLSPTMRAMVYGIVGGMPLYLSWWDAGASLEENLTALACRQNAPMIVEGDYLLATEAQHAGRLTEVLRAIAEGRTKHNEIADAVGIDPSRTLRELITLRLIERMQPVTEKSSTRRRIYRLTDNFLAFYFAVLTPYRNEIDRGLGDTVLPAVLDGINDHMGPVWEEAFRDYLRLRAADIDPRTVAIGPWWHGGGQDEIDAVALAGRSRNPVLVGEAKWARRVNGDKIRAQLSRKALALTNEIEHLRYAVCAREEITSTDPNLWCITAEDIFG